VTAQVRVLLTLASTVGGAALFAYVVQRAGVAEIVDGIQRVGWGLAIVLAFQGLRFALRTICWRLCLPPDRPLRFARAFGAFLAGDAIGSVTPLGLLASEPTKVFLTRHHLATGDSVASLAVENLIYAASVAVMVIVGLVVLLATVPLPPVWRWATLAGIGALVLAVAVVRHLLRRTWVSAEPLSPWRAQFRRVRLAVIGFADAYSRRLWQAFALDGVFHALAVAEVFVTLRWLLGDQSPTVGQAVVFETLNRAVTVAFKFVPFRIGVDEAFTGAAAPFLAVSPTAGIALAVVRKVRNLFWSGVGLVIIAAHPAQVGRTSVDVLP
jgi:glycosyltransferase 2 family protein